MASNQNPSEFSSTADSLNTKPDANTARTDTLSDEALSACKADCDTTWKTNWYELEATKLLNDWNNCETEAWNYKRQQEKICDSYDSMSRSICYYEVRNATEYLRTNCVRNKILANDGLKSPTNYASGLSWYDGITRCQSYIKKNADAKAQICINKNCR